MKIAVKNNHSEPLNLFPISETVLDAGQEVVLDQVPIEVLHENNAFRKLVAAGKITWYVVPAA
jgi:hypothetical protein